MAGPQQRRRRAYEALLKEKEAECEKLRAELASTKSDEDTKAEHDAELERLKAEHGAELEKLKGEHKAELDKMKAELEKAKKALEKPEPKSKKKSKK